MRKKTHAEFVNQFNQIHQDKGYKVVGEYIGALTKIAIECPIHGIWNATPADLLQRQGCRQCGYKQNGDKRRTTQSKFIDQFNQVHKGKDYKVIGEYINNQTKIAIECSVHGIWEASPSNLLRGRGCPECGGCQKKTHTEFVNQFNQIHQGKGYKVIGEYIGALTKIAIQCPTHGVWEAAASNLLRGQGCFACGSKHTADKKRKSPAQFIEKFNQVHQGKGYKVVGEYVSCQTKIAIECPIHGIWEARSQDLLRKGYGCPQCATKRVADKQRTTQSEFVDQFNRVHNGKGYQVLGKYTNAFTKITIECPAHGIWEAQPGNLLYGQGCPCCAKSGFHSNQPATFYLYEIIQNKNTYYGFGISNVYKRREKTHLRHLTEAGANVTQKWLYQFESGYECKGLEDDLKAALTEAGLNHNLGIEGFLTECAKEQARDLIMRQINSTI